MSLSAHFFAVAGLFDTGCLSRAMFAPAVPGDSPMTTDDKVNLLYMTYSYCFSLCPGTSVIISLSGVMPGFWHWHHLARH